MLLMLWAAEMRWVRGWTAAVLVAFCACTASARAEKPSDLPRPQGYIADFAGVLDQADVVRIATLDHELETKANARLELVTVHSTDGEDISQFATELEDRWKIGDAKLHRGALLILAINDRKRRVEVGDGLEGVLPDAKVGDIQDAATPELKAGRYGAAAFEIERGMAQAIAQDAGVALDSAVMGGDLPQTPQQSHRQSARSGNGLGFLVFVGIIALIFFSGLRRRSGYGQRTGTGGNGLMWFLLGNVLGGMGRRGGGGFGGPDGGGFGGGDDGGGGSGDGGFHDDGGWGGGSSGGGASGDW